MDINIYDYIIIGSRENFISMKEKRIIYKAFR